MVSCLINYLDLRLKENAVTKISAYLSIVLIIPTVGSVVAIIIRLIKLSKNINEEALKELNLNSSSLISDLKESSLNKTIVILWKPLNLIR